MNIGGLVVRIILTIVGAGAMIVGSFLNWFQSTAGTRISMKAYIGTPHVVSTLIRSAGAITILLGLIALVGLALPTGWLTRIAGALGIVAFILFAIQVQQAPNASISNIAAGAWIVLAGGVVALIGGFFGTRPAVVYTGATAAQTAA